MTHITRKISVAIATLSMTGALGIGMASPAPSMATDAVSTSQYAPAGMPWLCYSRLAGYKWFQYSNCTGMSSPAFR